jgi:CRISPR-associated endonuclease/helicase Cas3
MDSAGDLPLAIVKRIAEELTRGGKVLWVLNTVNRVMDAAGRAAKSGLSPLIYHSRFRYEDRVNRHSDVVDAFDAKKSAGASLACCSQVAEMSLDLSATLLVTDLAPVPALIQRLGRLNRRAQPASPGEPVPPTMPFIVIEPDTEAPYKTQENPRPFEAARKWLGQLGKRPLSQEALASAWEQLDDSEPPSRITSKWVDGGPITQVGELREGTPGITVVMERDVPDLRAGRKRLTEVALPMPLPRGFDWKKWRDFRGVPIAPETTVCYNPMTGARWNAPPEENR